MSMDPALAWAAAGLILVLVELVTGTFYLLVLAIAAFGAAATAYFGHGFPLQSIVAAVMAVLGVYLVHAYRARNVAQQMPSPDAGQPAHFESWIDQRAGLARVRYRGAQWEARIENGEALQAGALVYVLATEGNVLRISTRAPGAA